MRVTIRKTKEEYFSDDTLGAVYLHNWNGCNGRLYCRLPSGDDSHIHVRLPTEPHPDGYPSWEIQAGVNRETGEVLENITLTPSINCTGNKKWHGYLTNGQFVEC